MQQIGVPPRALSRSLTPQEQIKDRLQKMRLKLKNTQTQVSQQFRERIEKSHQKLKTGVVKPVTVHLRDSITFTLSVTSLLLTAYFMGAYPEWMAAWYTVWLCALLLLRFVAYYLSAWHLFMIDYCYFHNATLVLVLFLYPNSVELYQMLFTGSHGMLLWAIPLWSNAAVFHDYDKVTSAYLHIVPSLLQYSKRWHTELMNELPATLSMGRALYLHACMYIFWQISYSIFLHNESQQIKSRRLTTSFGWLQEKPPGGKKGVLFRVANMFGPSYLQLMFILLQGVIQFCATIPCSFIYGNRLLHSVYILFFILVLIWNGARFYIEKFSKDYNDRVERVYKAALAMEAIAMESIANQRDGTVHHNPHEGSQMATSGEP